MAAEPLRASVRHAAPSCSRFWVAKLLPARRPRRRRLCRPRHLLQRLPPRVDSLFMLQQLAYVIITPYTLYKSRTGGILARLITRTGLEMVAARMFSPSTELVPDYSKLI